MHKIFLKNGEHKTQKKLTSFFGNTLFASEAQVNLMSISRKDDLESLMYLMYFFFKGSLPILDVLNHEFEDNMINDF